MIVKIIPASQTHLALINSMVMTASVLLVSREYTVSQVSILFHAERPNRLTQSCTQFKYPGVKIICVMHCFKKWHSLLNDVEMKS